MGHIWRTGVVVGLTLLGGATAALAQAGGHAKSGASATSHPSASSHHPRGGLVLPGIPGAALAPGMTGQALTPALVHRPMPGAGATGPIVTPAPGHSSMSYQRLTSVRREPVGSSSGMVPGRAGARSGGAGRVASGDPLQSYSLRTPQARNAGVPTGSTAHQESRRAAAAPLAVRTTSHNYFPGMRPAQHPNASAARTGGRMGGNPRCTPGRGQFLRGEAGAASPLGAVRHR